MAAQGRVARLCSLATVLAADLLNWTAVDAVDAVDAFQPFWQWGHRACYSYDRYVDSR